MPDEQPLTDEKTILVRALAASRYLLHIAVIGCLIA